MDKIINIRAFNRAFCLPTAQYVSFVEISAAGLIAGTVPTIGIEIAHAKAVAPLYSRYCKQ